MGLLHKSRGALCLSSVDKYPMRRGEKIGKNPQILDVFWPKSTWVCQVYELGRQILASEAEISKSIVDL